MLLLLLLGWTFKLSYVNCSIRLSTSPSLFHAHRDKHTHTQTLSLDNFQSPTGYPNCNFFPSVSNSSVKSTHYTYYCLLRFFFFNFYVIYYMIFSFSVCLDGTLPGYHWHRGHGSGANSWLIQLEVCGIDLKWHNFMHYICIVVASYPLPKINLYVFICFSLGIFTIRIF